MTQHQDKTVKNKRQHFQTYQQNLNCVYIRLDIYFFFKCSSANKSKQHTLDKCYNFEYFLSFKNMFRSSFVVVLITHAIQSQQEIDGDKNGVVFQ